MIKKKFKFANLQSSFAKDQLSKKNIKIEPNNLSSIYVINKKKEIFSKYKASTYVLKEVNKLFLVIYSLNYILPKKIIDFFMTQSAQEDIKCLESMTGLTS